MVDKHHGAGVQLQPDCARRPHQDGCQQHCRARLPWPRDEPALQRPGHDGRQHLNLHHHAGATPAFVLLIKLENTVARCAPPHTGGPAHARNPATALYRPKLRVLPLNLCADVHAFLMAACIEGTTRAQTQNLHRNAGQILTRRRCKLTLPLTT